MVFERDWQENWNACQQAQRDMLVMGFRCILRDLERLEAPPGQHKWWVLENRNEKSVENARFLLVAVESLPYWLQRVRELEVKWLAATESKIALTHLVRIMEDRVRELAWERNVYKAMLEGRR